MIYKLLKANYVNKNEVCYSEEYINKLAKQYKDKELNIYCKKDIDILDYDGNDDYLKDKTVYGKISNIRKEDDYLICDLEFDKDKLKTVYNKCYLDNIYFASPTHKNNIREVDECEMGVHYFNDGECASAFREVIKLEEK